MKKIKVIDDIGIDNEETSNKDEVLKTVAEDTMPEVNLEELKSKLNKTMKSVSLKFGVIGCGHAGSRLAQSFYELGYAAIAINTATQDLTCIKLPEENKLFMDTGLNGAAKDLTRGYDAAETYGSKIQELINDKLSDSQVLIITTSTGGGTGAGSIPVVVELAAATGKPVVIIGALPMVTEDVKTKSNSLETLQKLSGYIASGKVQSFILVDNGKIENIYSGIGQMEFYGIANKAIVEPLDVFNEYSMKPSSFKALDSAEFATLLLNSGGISTMGQILIKEYEGELAISQAIMQSLKNSVLVEGIDLSKAKNVGYMILANKKVWESIPAGAINYANALINDIFNNPECTYKGIYETGNKEDVVRIYTFISGLGLPEERISGLKKEIDAQQLNIKSKDVERVNQLKVDLGKDKTVSNVDEIKARISQMLSGLGKLTSLGKKNI